MRADAITKDYVRNVDIFADIFNYYIYGGEQIIRPEQLQEKDPTEIALPYGADGAIVPIQKFRDIQKIYSIMTDGEIEYVLYGAELQSETHYAMPIRNNLYDALDYAGQAEEAARSHRKELKERKREKFGDDSDLKENEYMPNRGEFLSGFWKTDKLIPSITLTIHFGAEPWDGPLSLFDMMSTKNQKILACMDNYHIRMISPALMSDEDIMKFQSSFREVMLFVKYSKDRRSLQKMLAAHEDRFRSLERRAADVISAVTRLKTNFGDEKERVDMCQAVQEMCDESRIKGKAEGEMQKAQEIARNLYSMGMLPEQIAQGVGSPVETVRQWLGI